MTTTLTLKASRAISTRPRVPLPLETYSDDIDWIAVQRVVEDDRPLPALTREEQRVAALLLTAAGRSEKDTARLVGTHDRQIARWKEQAGTKPTRSCTVDDCNNPIKALGLCHRHYRQEQRRRNPQPPKPTKTTCRRGHAYPDCLGYRASGKAYCRPCDRASRKAYRERQSNLSRQQLGEAA
ncbi:helix-turn-helix domain-containing protein [Streptomyces sp. NPDC058290]|uniref:helix-turn-helix domain-containing protein n=1 Tax=Streptomyces sp. NPDC058290 TaxID=3346426 RepID=UPI0036E47105